MRRIPTADRRQQILEVAGRLLEERGVDGVEISTVARRARVSRPLVYRLFPTRDALVAALLDDFVAALDRRFRDALVASLSRPLGSVVIAFVEACCETIEERGAGPWRLLDARGVDVALTRAGADALGRLVDPWLERIRELTGMAPRRARSLVGVVVAAGRAMLEGWLEGSLSRKQAVADTARVVTVLLAEFAA
jgi:AcrR family transcriptional regulator